MQSEQKQRIMGYFIEETKEHLNTMQQALLSLPNTIEDKEILNEVYRAAHSIKGGAAMLELNSIQKTAHRLEDCFKNLKESPVQADEHLESLFLRVLDTLDKLVGQLQGPSGLTDEIADEIMSDAEPVLQELSNHLQELQQPTSSSATVANQELVLAGNSLGALTLTDDESGIILAQPIYDETDDSFSQVKETPAAQITDVTAAIDDSQPASLHHAEVGLAELDTLADIFEGQTPELEETWEKEEIISLDGLELASDSLHSFNLDDESDFADLIGDLDSWETSIADSQVLGTQETSTSTGEDFIDWLGENLSEEVVLNSQDTTDDFSDLLFEREEPQSLIAETGSTKNLSSFFGDTSEILGDGEDENNDLAIDNSREIRQQGVGSRTHPQPLPGGGSGRGKEIVSSQELDNLGGAQSQGDEVAPRDSESEFNDLLAIASNDQEDLEFGEELMIDEEANDFDLAALELDESDFNLTNEKSDWQTDLFGGEASVPTQEVETPPQMTNEVDELASLLEEQELDWQTDLFGSEAFVPTQETEALPQMTNEVDELASLLGEAMPVEEQELDWQTDLFGSEASVPTQEAETLPHTSEVDELASLLGEAMPVEEQELDWQTDLFGSEASVPTQEIETLPHTSEVDELASLLEEAMPVEEQELDWQTDLFGSEVSVPTQEVETLPQMINETDELASFLGEQIPVEEQELESIAQQGIDNLLQEETTEALEPEEIQEFLRTQVDEVTDTAPVPAVVSEFDELETMLEEESPLINIPSQVDVFDELEAMLEEEPPLAMTTNTPLVATATSSASTATDVFKELENLLEEETPLAVAQSSGLEERAAKTEDDDDFGDLEKLLEQAEETMGGQPTLKADQRQTKPQSRPRPRMFDQTMRVQIKRLDDLSNLVGELVVNRNSLEQDQERLRQFLDNLNHQVLSLNDVGARMQDLYERSLLESSLLASRYNYRSFFSGEQSLESSHANGAEYDPLEMDRFTGFHTLSQEMIELIVRVRESASDIVFLADGTDQVARTLRQITTQLQEGLTRARMVPFAQTADRLPRAVRDISLKLGKQAELQVEGRETLIDKMIIEHLNAPMTHLVNNAITHGIEAPEVRQAANKPSVGKIIVRAFYQGNQAVISISDDGAGINPERVRNKIIEKKLLTPAEAKKLTNLDLYEFLFDAGFTTKDKEDEYAGRGVGMDVVRTKLNEIRGTIHTDSTLGKGTTFTIRLPLTLSIGKALCCLSDRATIAFPMDGVEDTFDIPPDRIQTDSEGQSFIQWKETRLPFKPLSELLKYNRQLSRGSVYGGKREDGLISILVLRSAGNSFLSIQVDQVLSEQEIVIKQLEGPAPKPVGIAGATVLGDGRIMPIADVMELIDLSRRPSRPDSNIWSRTEAEEQAPVEEAPHEPMVLIVDDSITVRSLLEMTFSKAGYRVEQARDGQEAWEKLRSGLPCDIIFCDIEMPRMNGMELLKKLQEDENLRNIPISMLTSRGADRHRQMAVQLGASGYFTKPYLEEVLLEAAQQMINGEVLLDSSSNA